MHDGWNLGAPVLGGMRVLGFLGQDASDFGSGQSGLAQIYPQAEECGIALALGRGPPFTTAGINEGMIHLA